MKACRVWVVRAVFVIRTNPNPSNDVGSIHSSWQTSASAKCGADRTAGEAGGRRAPWGHVTFRADVLLTAGSTQLSELRSQTFLPLLHVFSRLAADTRSMHATDAASTEQSTDRHGRRVMSTKTPQSKTPFQ